MSSAAGRYSAEQLKEFVKSVLGKLGAPAEDAAIAADALVHAALLGVDSHGVARLEKHPAFLPGLKNGLINPSPKVRVVRETPAAALLDGDNGLGVVVATRAMRLAIEKAAKAGVGAVAVTNTHHLGIACHYAMMALERRMIGLAMTNAYSQMVPPGGKKATLGTNPISLAAPAGDHAPFILDLASSVTSAGRIEILSRAGKPIPEGWLVDREGRPTTDPNDLWNGGALLPIGGRPELGSYKGYGLAVMVDVLSGVLSGAGYGAALDPVSWTTGHFMLAINIEAFRPFIDFQRMMDAMLTTLKATPTVEGAERVTVPGERKLATKAERSRLGIPLHPAVVESLERVGKEFSVPFPPA